MVVSLGPTPRSGSSLDQQKMPMPSVAHVEHHHPDRVEIYWESKIAANTTEPGADGIPPDGPWYDRYWEPLTEKPAEPAEEVVTARGKAQT